QLRVRVERAVHTTDAALLAELRTQHAAQEKFLKVDLPGAVNHAGKVVVARERVGATGRCPERAAATEPEAAIVRLVDFDAPIERYVADGGGVRADTAAADARNRRVGGTRRLVEHDRQRDVEAQPARYLCPYGQIGHELPADRIVDQV